MLNMHGGNGDSYYPKGQNLITHPLLKAQMVYWEFKLCICSTCKPLEPKLCLEAPKSLWHTPKEHIVCLANLLRPRTQNAVARPRAKYHLLRFLSHARNRSLLSLRVSPLVHMYTEALQGIETQLLLLKGQIISCY